MMVGHMESKRNREADLRALLESPSNLVIFALDRDYRYVAWNEAHRQTIKSIWGKDVSLGVNMLEFLVGHPDHAKAQKQFDRALSGEQFVVVDEYGEEKLSRRWYENAYNPLVAADGSIIGLTCFLTDVTEQRRAADDLHEARARLEALVEERTASLQKSKELEERLAKRNEELAARDRENVDLVERLRLAIEELSTPVLEVGDDVLALPVIGVVDTQRSIQMEERLLAAIMERRSRFVIVDLTGVDAIDTSTAARFVKLARSVRLLGAECIITGIQPGVAQSLVTLQVEFSGIQTKRSLKDGIEACLSRGTSGVREAPRSPR
jgi:rsbT co-antagonist protein RsbR